MKKFDYKFHLILLSLLFVTSACEDNSGPKIISIGSELCLTTLHHERGLPDITVYIKYNATEFPGYDDLSTFDDSVISDEFADACFERVPPGQHWCVGIGHDDLLDEPVQGSVFYEISRTGLPQDTVIYVSEY